VMREGCKSSGGIRGARQWRGGAAARGISNRVGRRGEGGEFDRWGSIDRETRERRPAREGMIRKGKRISVCGDGAVGGRAGPEAKRAAGSAGPKARKRISELKIRFLNLTRLWKFVEGDLGGILT
jgi:hypothetical protein